MYAHGMETRPLGRTGIDVPVIGLGTWRVFNVRDTEGEARCEAVVTAALDSGARLIDTSPMYGESERVVALSLAGRRDRALVATKVWARTRAIGEQQIERALDWFERVDLYQVHNMLLYDAHMPYLEHLRDAGRVRAIGVTHYLPGDFPAVVDAMRSGRIDAIQVPYHPLERTVESEVLAVADELGIGVIAMTPFKSGELVAGAPPDGALEPLRPLGVRTWAQALLKWVLSDPRVTAVIPATSSPSRMAENAAAGQPPWFGPAERDYVRDLAVRCIAE